MLPNTIMIIEDEAITQRYLKDIIHHLNIELVGYFDGSEGVMERLQSTQPDMILMDINLKGAMDGIELTRKILSKYQIPIVFITAYHDDNTVEEVIELSPYGFVIKPFTSKGIQIALKLAYKKFITHHKDIAKHSLNSHISIGKTFSFDTQNSKLYHQNEMVKLTPKQTLLLELLSKNLNNTVSSECITNVVWGDGEYAESSLRTLIYSIRKQLPSLPLHSDSKRGYFLSSH